MQRTEISPEIRRKVYERDSWEETPCCIYCGKQRPEVHHYVERSRGGMGIPENLVCLCYECHRRLHNGDTHIKRYCRSYLESKYEDWNENDVIVRKGDK